MRRGPGLDAVLASLATGDALDWRAAESSAADETERSLIRQLRIVSSIADLHASLPPPETTAARGVARSGAPNTSLGRWGSLELLEKIGQGTYGEVFRAWDPKLERQVALKLLWPSVGQDVTSSVMEEGRLVARVRHPNIVTVYGADAHDGRIGLWMELVDGRTLESVLQSSGPLSAAEAAGIGVTVCRALAAVHELGIVHGDVKAQNVMSAHDGRIVVTDFGTGRELQPLAGPAREGQHVSGTPLYLAPEVLEGRPPTPSSDVYSIGVLLYRLVSGRYPVTGASLDQVRAAHRAGGRVGLRDAHTGVDPRFARAVERALAPSPADRFENAHALAAELARVCNRPQRNLAWRAAVLFVGMAATLGAAGLWQARLRPTTHLGQEQTSAVLIIPFENATGDPAFDDALDTALERELVVAPALSIASRGRVEDALTLMKKRPDTALDAAIARDVCLRDGGIGAYVTGRVEGQRREFVLTAAVHVPADDRIVAVVRESLQDVHDAPRGIRVLASRLRAALGQTPKEVWDAVEQLERVTTPSLRALRLYSASYELGKRNEWPAALAMVEDALREDPSFAAALIWKAWCIRNSQPLPGPLPETFMPFAERALELSASVSDWERYWIRGSYHSLEKDDAGAIPYYQALLQVLPDHHWALNNLQVALRRVGRGQEVLASAMSAAQARPNAVGQHSIVTMLLLMEGGVQRAAPYAARVRELTSHGEHRLDRGIESAWLLPSTRAWVSGDTDLAVRELRAVESGPALRPPDAEAFRHALFESYLRMGRLEDARRIAMEFSAPRWQHIRLALVAHFAGHHDAVSQELDLANAAEPVDLGLRDGFLTLTTVGRIELVWQAIWLYLQQGRVGEADAFAANLRELRNSWTEPQLSGLKALALGRPEDAVRHLSFRDLPYRAERNEGIGYLHNAVALADALTRIGQRDRAIDTLRRVIFVRPWTYPTQGVFRMVVQRQLSTLLRDSGRIQEAETLDAEACRLLAGADAWFILRHGL